MYGSRVCAAHGGRAPQVREAAKRRAIEARLWTMFAAERARREVEREAMAPWTDALQDVSLQLAPDESARRLRAIATQMSKRAKELRAIAHQFDEASAAGEPSLDGGTYEARDARQRR